MRNNLYVVLGLWIIFIGNESLIAMHESIKVKIENLRIAHVAEIRQHEKGCSDCLVDQACGRSEIAQKFTKQVGELVLNAGDLVTDQEKLNHAYGKLLYPQRKEVIKKMISEGQHPNNIVYQLNEETPLKKAVKFEDEEFIRFLREHGAD